jgi:hypothetical protein
MPVRRRCRHEKLAIGELVAIGRLDLPVRESLDFVHGPLALMKGGHGHKLLGVEDVTQLGNPAYAGLAVALPFEGVGA